jgi:hypothetical protein
VPAPLTDKQRQFAIEYASNGGNATAAAKAAGYSETTAHEIGRQTVNKPHVADLIRAQLSSLKAKSGAIGLHALVEICQDKNASANARVSAARALCEHAGILGSGRETVEGAMADPDGQTEIVTAREVIAAFRQVTIVRGLMD